jgi:hypothetical protein
MLRRDPERVLADELVAECEAFLAGRYAEHLEARRLRVPAWAWVNLLAHGTVGELEAARHVTADDGSPSAQWRAARAFLAREVLEAAAAADTTLADVQRRLLVPLELELMGWPAALWGPRHVVLRVLGVLRPRSGSTG